MEKDKRVLVFGSGGLIGSNVTRILKENKYQHLGLVSLRGANTNDRHQLLQMDPAHTKMYWFNLLTPIKLADHSLEEIEKDPDMMASLLTFIDAPLNESVEQSTIFEIFKEFQPSVVIDCSNIATVLAYDHTHHQKLPEKTRQLWRGRDVSFELLLKYFQLLSAVLNNEFWEKKGESFHVAKYVKVGTTGIGGMGLDLPFTHGEERPSKDLLRKVSFAGAQTMLLVGLSNMKHGPVVKEVKPATAVFDTIPKQLPKKKDADTDYPQDMKVTDLTNYPTAPRELQEADLPGVYVDGGESGYYSIEEFRLLTHPQHMGMISAEEVAVYVLKVLEHDDGEDVVHSLKKASVGPSTALESIREKMLESIEGDDIALIATGNLGPRRVSKLLVEAEIIRRAHQNLASKDSQNTSQLRENAVTVLSHSDMKRSLQSLGMPVLIDERTVRVFGKSILGNIDIEKEHSNIIDLTETNITLWLKRLKLFENAHDSDKELPRAGDIVSKVIESEGIDIALSRF